jgi:hypothetical protein
VDAVLLVNQVEHPGRIFYLAYEVHPWAPALITPRNALGSLGIVGRLMIQR